MESVKKEGPFAPAGLTGADAPTPPLPACPFCGDGARIVVCETPRRGWHARCLECGAQGPVAPYSDAKAADLWRERVLDLQALSMAVSIASNASGLTDEDWSWIYKAQKTLAKAAPAAPEAEGRRDNP